MRPVPLLAALTVLMLLPLGTGQSGEATPQTATVEDGDGDVVIQGDGPDQSAPQDQMAHVDILKTWIGAETEDSITVGIERAATEGDAELGPWGEANFGVFFRADEVDYRVTTSGWGCGGSRGALQEWDADNGFYRTRTCLDGSDEGTETLFIVPREAVVDQNRVPLRAGETLDDLHAEAWAWYVFSPSWGPLPQTIEGARAYDRAPDDGFGPAFESVMGVKGRGDIHAFAPDPMRVSNGEATTIVYSVQLTNRADVKDTVLLRVEGLMDGWNTRVPERLTVGAGETVEFPVILSLPFSHRHGESQLFDIIAESTNDPKHFSIENLGVFWTEVPQPSGHHGGQIWLHSAPSEEGGFTGALGAAYEFKRLWMNGIDDDPDPSADDAPAPAYFNTAIFEQEARGETGWEFRLSPRLLMGLDFDLTQPATFTTVIDSNVPAQEAVLEVELEYCDPHAERQGGQGGWGGRSGCPGRWMDIGTGTSDVKSLSAGASTTFEIAFDIIDDADLLPYAKDANLRLNVELRTDTPQNAGSPAPHVALQVDESLLVLPLLEYHDPVDQAFEDVGTLQLDPLHKNPEKKVNAGEGVVFSFLVRNKADASQQVRLDVEGVGADWASWHGQSLFTLGAGDARNVSLVVRAPVDATVDERAELFAIAENADDPNVVTASRVRAIVVDEDVPDEAAALGDPGGKESPSVGLLVAVGALAGLAAARGRRGQS